MAKSCLIRMSSQLIRRIRNSQLIGRMTGHLKAIMMDIMIEIMINMMIMIINMITIMLGTEARIGRTGMMIELIEMIVKEIEGEEND